MANSSRGTSTMTSLFFTHLHPLLSIHLDSQTTMPYISTEALVGAALLVVVALGYQYIPKTGGEAATASKAIKKKNKKKAKASGGSTTASDIKDAVTTGPSSSKKGNETIKSKENGAGSTSKAAPSDPAQVSRQTAKPKTLAQKIAPQPRKSKVDEWVLGPLS